MYRDLKKELKGIRKRKKSDYEKWCASREKIDAFYAKETVSSDEMYRRLLDLKARLDGVNALKVPILISIGVWVVTLFSTQVVLEMLRLIRHFEDALQEVYTAYVDKLPAHMLEEAQAVISAVKSEKMPLLYGAFAVLVVCLIVAAIFLYRGAGKGYARLPLVLEVYKYEIEKIEQLLKAKEAQTAKAVLKLENASCVLEYVLTAVREK